MDEDDFGLLSDRAEGLLHPLVQDTEKTLNALREGNIENVAVSCKRPVDCIVNYGLDSGVIEDFLEKFPDPRKNFSVPMNVMLLSKIIQVLNNNNSLISAPYLLNDSSVMAKLGYNFKVCKEGFNNQNRTSRETPCHGDTLRHILSRSRPEKLIKWFNEAATIFEKESPGETGLYLMDGTKLKIPAHLVNKYQDAGTVRTDKDTVEHGYKVVWIYKVIDKKGVILGMKMAPINVHDSVLGKELVEEFNFGKKPLLVMDRGFLDKKWIKSLKEDRDIDVCIPLKKNSFLSELAMNNHSPEYPWESHPTRKGQKVRRMSADELEWEDCPVFKSGVVIKFKNKKTGEEEQRVIVDTRENIVPKKLLGTYDQRWDIEEAHRQMKLFQGLEDFKSKKYTFVVFHVVMGAVAYNLFNLFLNSEDCKDLKEFTLKLHSQKRSIKVEVNPDIIIYAKDSFAIIKNLDFLQLILGFPDKIQEKLQDIFAGLSAKYNTS